LNAAESANSIHLVKLLQKAGMIWKAIHLTYWWFPAQQIVHSMGGSQLPAMDMNLTHRYWGGRVA
jgi:hypothetical protein